jgi:hypothetical protein
MPDTGMAAASPSLPDAQVVLEECIITSADLVRPATGPNPLNVRDYALGSFGTLRAHETASSAFAWEGSFEGAGASARGTILHNRTSVGDVVAVHFADGSTIQAIPLGDGTTRVIRSTGSLPGCAGALVPPQEPADENGARPAAGGAGTTGGIAGSCDDGSVIDVLVMWTPRAQSESGSAAAARAIAEASVAITNHVYATSLVNVRMRAVGYGLTEPYTRDGTSNPIYDLTDPSDGYLDTVHTTRNALGADVVALITGQNLNYCGIAWIAGDDSPEYGFSVTVWNCALGNLTFTHEVGHNQGCCHAPGDGGGCTTGGIFSYSVGHRFNGTSGTQWRTVMAYSPGTRVPRFSSPLVTHDGSATGTASADNARSINVTAEVMANYRCAVEPDTGAKTWIDSGLRVPPAGGASETITVTDAYAAADGTEVEILLAARADHDAANETFSLSINGTSFGTLIGGTGENCAIAARTRVIGAAEFNAALLAASPAQLAITSSAAVDACSPPGELRLAIRYVAATGSTTCDTPVLFYADQDGDGYTLATGAHYCPGTTNPGFRPMRSALLDCDDASPSAFPGAAELCATAGTDNDCDGSMTDIDSDAADRVTFYSDADGDSYTLATGARFCAGTSSPGYRATASSPLDCNDASAATYPGAPELCATVGTDNDCDGNTSEVDAEAADRVAFYTDADGDSYTLATGALFCSGTTNQGYRATSSSPLDCNDGSPAIYPGAPELCATVGTDNDCDGNTSEVDANAADRVLFYRDQDNDSYTLSTGSRFCAGTNNPGFRAQRSTPLDCNDSVASIYPGAPELCATAGTDNDCDGSTADTDPDAPDRATFYPDQDGDGYTLPIPFLACPGTAGAGYVTQQSTPDDCDDSNPDIYPSAPELCDTIGTDNDCDGDLYEAAGAKTFWRDADGDGFGSTPTTLPSCSPPDGFVAQSGDCDDASPSAYPGAPELCATAGTDNDCDGDNADTDADAADRVTFFSDTDGDGYTLATGSLFCVGTTNAGFRAQASEPLDCDDWSPTVYPGAPELCATAGTDNDCDGDNADTDADAADRVMFFSDADGDGYTLATGSLFCVGTANAGFRAQVSEPLDCDDGSPAVYPGAPELCATTSTDNDCDGDSADTDTEAADRVTFFSDTDGDGYTLATGSLFCVGTTNAGFRAQVSEPLDCDDGSPAVYPGAPELCATNSTDNDCDGDSADTDADAADRVMFFSDADGDGYTLASGALFCAGTTNAGFRAQVSEPLDCDDGSPAVYPGAPELCATNSTDNDCDGDSADTDADAADRVMFFSDTDGDGYTLASGALFCAGTTNAGFRAEASAPLDCDDGSPAAFPGAPETCATVGADNDCDGDSSESTDEAIWYSDADGDGYGDSAVIQESCTQPPGFVAVAGDDCPTIGSLQAPLPYFVDADGDTYGSSTTAAFCALSAPAGHADRSGDCNDASASTYPGAPELCATLGTDNNCDGNSTDATDLRTFYFDADGDGRGDDSATTLACTAPPGYVAIGGDGCPANPFAQAPILWYRDADGDMFGNPNQSQLACTQPAGHIPIALDCDDTRSWVNPSAQERCDAANIDEDCDGLADDADLSAIGTTAWYADGDGDGYGSGSPFNACDAPSPSHVAVAGDCDDGSAAVYPGAPETCATIGTDNDCDGDTADATDPSTWYADSDGDGYGDAAAIETSCTQPPGFVAVAGDNCPTNESLQAPIPYFIDSDGDSYGSGATAAFCALSAPAGHSATTGDCDDGSAAVYPGAPETCATIGTDNDCDGDTADATDPSTWYADTDGDGYGVAAMTQDSCTQPPGFVAVAGDNCPSNGSLQSPIAYFIDSDGDSYGSGATAAFCALSAPAGHSATTGDCDDGSAVVYPGATETCATIGTDNDCDGDTADATDPSIWYADTDGDGYGDAAATEASCTQPPGFVAVAGDNCPALFNPDQADCTKDGIGNACEVANGAPDCDFNGVPDSCQVSAGGDADGDGVLDSCQGDCNLNGIPDTQDLAQGLSTDCNGNGFPDDCEDGTVHADTGNMGAPLAGAILVANLNGQIPSRTPVTVTLEARGDFDAADEYVRISLNGLEVAADALSDGGTSCGTLPDAHMITITEVEWLQVLDAAAEPGHVSVSLTISASADSSSCPTAFARVTVAYGGTAYDCDGDGYSDICQFDPETDDCNANGIFDACETGGPGDTDSDGTPDTCEQARGDFNLDGFIDGVDLSALLTSWGAINPVFGDIVQDGQVDGADLASLLAKWGPLP